jgi:hypothetical protein
MKKLFKKAKKPAVAVEAPKPIVAGTHCNKHCN